MTGTSSPSRRPGRLRRYIALRCVAFAVILQGCQGCTHSNAVADRPNNNMPLRMKMPSFALANPGLVAIYQDFADEVFVLAVLGKNRILHTAEFAQTGRERAHLETDKWVSWDVPVPEGALLFGATSAVSASMSHQFWVGWLLGRRLHMQALMQLKPIEIAIDADEVPILPAVTDHSGVGNLYSWRPAGSGTALWRHSFSGQIKTAGSVTSEAQSEIPGQPVVSIAGTIPGEESQHAVIGWVEATAEGAVLGVALVSPERMRVIRSEPIPGMVPIVRQRLGVWAGSPMSAGRFQLVAVVQSQAEQPAYSIAAMNIGPNADQGAISLSGIDIPAGTLHSAAFDVNKDYYYDVKPSFSPTFLTEDGDLWARKRPEVLRHSVDLDSPLPVASTSVGTYWGVRAADGTVTFEWFQP